MRLMIAMASTMVMSSGRTRPAGRYMTLPDIGVGAWAERHSTSRSRAARAGSHLPGIFDVDQGASRTRPSAMSNAAMAYPTCAGTR
jgi:hypothetical protein